MCFKNVSQQFVKESWKWLCQDESVQYVGIIFDEVNVKSDIMTTTLENMWVM